MLSIFATTEFHEQLHQIIAKEDRLHELVTVIDLLAQKPTSNALTIPDQKRRNRIYARLAKHPTSFSSTRTN